MKTMAITALCGLTALLSSGIWGWGSSWAQEPPREERNRGTFVRDPAPDVDGRRARSAQPAMAPASPLRAKIKIMAHPDGMHELRSAAERLSNAEDDGARAQAEEKLSELLEDYFEKDMKRREQELADVEARLKNLRELMERRRAKKDDILALQKEVLVNEAEGLGFFNGAGPDGPHSPSLFGGREGAGDVFRFAVLPPPGAPGGTYQIYKQEKLESAYGETQESNDDRPRN